MVADIHHSCQTSDKFAQRRITPYQCHACGRHFYEVVDTRHGGGNCDVLGDSSENSELVKEVMRRIKRDICLLVLHSSDFFD